MPWSLTYRKVGKRAKNPPESPLDLNVPRTGSYTGAERKAVL